MKISNRVKRNISLTLVVIGVTCIISCLWDIIINPTSGKAWFDLARIALLTYLCFDRFRVLQRRVKSGIIFGSR